MRTGLRRCTSALSVAPLLAAFFACGGSDRPNATPSVVGDAGIETPDTAPQPPIICAPDPGKWDVPGNECDEDADGVVDNPPVCDQTGLTATAADFARAIGICTTVADKGYGLVSAKLTRGYQRSDLPKPEQYALLPKFGDVLKPREGAMLAVLSTGYASEYDGTAKEPFIPGTSWDLPGAVPPGYPAPAKGCPQELSVNDVIDVVLELKAPANALGFTFDFNFHSGEWPGYICSDFNDGFIAYVQAASINKGKGRNISFDSNDNPVSVNNGFFDRCTPGVQTGCLGGLSKATSVCPGGTAELAGTGFGIVDNICDKALPPTPSTSGGATGWLTSQSPIQPGERFTLEFMIWDTGDSMLDSLVLIDNFRWIGQPITKTETIRPPR